MVDFENPLFLTKLVVVVVLYLFLPLTAVTYFFFRHDRRRREVERVFELIQINPEYRKAYEEEKPGRYFFLAVVYASTLAAIGLALFAFGSELGLKFPTIDWRGAKFPEKGSELICGMAFFGAYLWGLQYIHRRYTLNDLIPAAYYGLCTRMLLAPVVALVLYNAAGAIGGIGDQKGGITPNIWPALALLLGMFPQRGIDWLTSRVPFLATPADPTVRPAPLEMVEGITIDDRLRLQESGIDTCYDLATADFVPLILRTPFGARELTDWIFQAKLVVCFGDAVKALRRNGIRTVVDLLRLDTTEMDALAVETPLTRSGLHRAHEAVKNDPEIERLQKFGRKLGKFVGEPGD